MQHKIDVRENVGNRVNRQDFDQSVFRKHFLSTQDIRNVKRSILERQIKRHENDATSVDIFVQELQHEPFIPVLLYKPQGNESEKYPSLRKDSFILAVQTEFQMKLYQEFSNKILCIDATHSTNAYRFKLITCLVQDEFNQGCPTISLYKIILTICNLQGNQ